MKRSVHALSASSSSDARQCLGTTLRGVRCSISSTSKFAGKDGRDLALPLRRGCDYCLAHLPVLVTEQTAWDVNTDVLLFYLDFETSGLDIFADHIVEFGMLCDSGECFSTVCIHYIHTYLHACIHALHTYTIFVIGLTLSGPSHCCISVGVMKCWQCMFCSCGRSLITIRTETTVRSEPRLLHTVARRVPHLYLLYDVADEAQHCLEP